MNASLQNLPPMVLALQANFGSVESWRSEFVALCSAQRALAGRVQLDFVPGQGALANRWVADDTPAGSEGEPLLQCATGEALDPEAWADDIDWAPAYRRYQLAVEAASEPFGAEAGAMPGAMLLDVRRAAVFDRAHTLVHGAHWRDPATVGRWASELPADRQIVVYCVHGHEVSRATALRLRAQGLQAHHLRGGIDGWTAAGGPLEAKHVASAATLSPDPPSGSAPPRSD